MKKTLILFLSLIGQFCYYIGFYEAYAQDVTKAGSLPFEQHTLSPTAASFAVYGEIPVSQYTGIPDISIPLYTLAVNDFQMPISLSYHPAGVRVESEASWVGLGWTLNAGGVITREIRGADDLNVVSIGNGSSIGYWYRFNHNNSRVPVPVNIPKCVRADDECRRYFDWIKDKPNINCMAPLSEFIQQRIMYADCEPDVYTYNFPGYSGRFTIDAETNKAVLEKPEDNLYIELVNESSNIFHFYVTLPTGIKFSFEIYEKSSSYRDKGYEVSVESISAWYMTAITLTDGKEIFLEYSSTGRIVGEAYQTKTNELPLPLRTSAKDEFEYHKIASNTRITKYATETEIPCFSGNGSQDLYTFRFQYDRGITQSGVLIYNELSLSKIYTESIEIQFIHQRRLDYGSPFGGDGKYPVCLSQIRVIANQKAIKTFSFGYSYFGNQKQGSATGTKANRLRLDYVKEGNLPAYRFTYNTKYELPSKLSLCYDVWGYYNGTVDYSNNTNDPVPDYPEIVKLDNSFYFDWEYPRLKNATLVKSGKNVRCNPEYISTGMLQKIQYPTGGYAEFTFEANDYDQSKKKGGGCRIAKIKTDSSERIFQYQNGRLLIQPVFIYTLTIEAYPYSSAQRTVVSSRSMVRLQGTQLGNHVGYGCVSETVRCDGKESSIVDYFYNDVERSENLYVYTTNNKNGHILKNQMYDNGTLVQETLYNYFIPPTKVPNLNAMKFDDGVMFCYKVFPEYREILTGKTVKDYFGTEVQTTTTRYDYDDNSYVNYIETKVNGKSNIKKIAYSGTLSKGVFSTLKLNNQLNLPVEETTLISDGKTEKVIGSELITYNSIGQPLNTYKLNLDAPVADFTYYSATSTEVAKDLRYNSQPEMSIEYGKFDKPKVAHFVNGVNVCYIWGDYGQYIIGKIENADWADLGAFFSGDSYNSYDTPEQDMYNKINELRTLLPNASVTTYYYDFGIGLKQVIFPDGVSGYYEYDEENRLKSVKDESGKVLNQYKYGYRQ